MKTRGTELYEMNDEETKKKDEIKAAVVEVMAGLESKVDHVIKDITGIKDSIEGVENRLSTLENTVSNLDNTIATRVAEQVGQATKTLREDMDTLQRNGSYHCAACQEESTRVREL